MSIRPILVIRVLLFIIPKSGNYHLIFKIAAEQEIGVIIPAYNPDLSVLQDIINRLEKLTDLPHLSFLRRRPWGAG